MLQYVQTKLHDLNLVSTSQYKIIWFGIENKNLDGSTVPCPSAPPKGSRATGLRSLKPSHGPVSV